MSVAGDFPGWGVNLGVGRGVTRPILFTTGWASAATLADIRNYLGP